MTLRDDNRVRLPGPLGSALEDVGGRLPGPLGFRHVFVAAPKAVGKMVKTLKMPPPANDSKTKKAHEVTFPLFNKGGPATGDIAQGSLANCPIASILAALAHTESGRRRIQGLLAEHPAAVVTDLSGVADTLEDPPKDNKILSKRFFTVMLENSAPEVSDVFYTDDADRNWSLIYMHSPTDALWPSVIEKAFAVRMGSYEKIDEQDSANVFWKVLVGTKPEILSINDRTPLSEISAIAQRAHKVPAIGASRDDAQDVSTWHGFAVLGIQGSVIELYDPAKAKPLKLSLTKFRANFKAMLSGSPA